jgi:hypothetical protein
VKVLQRGATERGAGTGEDPRPEAAAAELACVALVLAALELAEQACALVALEESADRAHARVAHRVERGLHEGGGDAGVGVGDQDDVGAVARERLIQRPRLAVLVALGGEHVGARAAGDLGRVVARAVVDDDHSIDLVAHRLDGGGDRRRLVVGGDEGQRGGGGRGGSHRDESGSGGKACSLFVQSLSREYSRVDFRHT